MTMVWTMVAVEMVKLIAQGQFLEIFCRYG